ncbi:MAG: hypothetical protein JWL83_3529 [Actinomycetia bacterium]|nr:hypothetical protein [Actinomycetes bacterium]
MPSTRSSATKAIAASVFAVLIEPVLSFGGPTRPSGEATSAFAGVVDVVVVATGLARFFTVVDVVVAVCVVVVTAAAVVAVVPRLGGGVRGVVGGTVCGATVGGVVAGGGGGGAVRGGSVGGGRVVGGTVVWSGGHGTTSPWSL